MLYKQITERGRKKRGINRWRHRNWPASDAVSGLAAFWITALAVPSTQWALMLHITYPYCMHIFSCLYANIKLDSAFVMQDVEALFPFIMFTSIQNFSGMLDLQKTLLNWPRRACSPAACKAPFQFLFILMQSFIVYVCMNPFACFFVLRYSYLQKSFSE